MARTQVTRICEECGIEFTRRLRDDGSQQRRCSVQCAAKFRTRDQSIRFWEKVDRNAPIPPNRPDLGNCWLWMASKAEFGYGLFAGHRAHRISWEFTNGPIPNRLQVLHACDTPACVRPEHLFLGTQSDNIQDALRKGRLPCGESSYNARLTAEQVKKIRTMSGSRQTIADHFGVHYGTINAIQRGVSWKWVKKEPGR